MNVAPGLPTSSPRLALRPQPSRTTHNFYARCGACRGSSASITRVMEVSSYARIGGPTDVVETQRAVCCVSGDERRRRVAWPTPAPHSHSSSVRTSLPASSKLACAALGLTSHHGRSARCLRAIPSCGSILSGFAPRSGVISSPDAPATVPIMEGSKPYEQLATMNNVSGICLRPAPSNR